MKAKCTCGHIFQSLKDSTHAPRFYPKSRSMAIVTCTDKNCGSSAHIFIQNGKWRAPTKVELKQAAGAIDLKKYAREE